MFLKVRLRMKIQVIKTKHELFKLYPRTPIFQVNIVYLRLDVFAIAVEQQS